MGSKRGKNFSAAEEKQLTLAYLHVSQDPIVGNGQKGVQFWKRTAAQFNTHRAKDTEVRLEKSLEGKWLQIRKDTTKFAAAFSAIAGLAESGTSFEHQLEKSLALYKAKHPKLEDYTYVDCWHILRHIPRWAELPQAMKKTTPLSDITNGSEVPSTGRGENSPNALVDSPSSGNVSNEDEHTSARPQGSKKAKDAVKRQNIVDDSLINQARAASELTLTIMEKVALMKEQAMVALFALKDDNGKLSPEVKEFFALKRAKDLARFKRDLEAEEHELSKQRKHGSIPRSQATSPATRAEHVRCEGDDYSFPTAHRSPLFGDENEEGEEEELHDDLEE